jgi:hypothetical protein
MGRVFIGLYFCFVKSILRLIMSVSRCDTVVRDKYVIS